MKFSTEGEFRCRTRLRRTVFYRTLNVGGWKSSIAKPAPEMLPPFCSGSVIPVKPSSAALRKVSTRKLARFVQFLSQWLDFRVSEFADRLLQQLLFFGWVEAHITLHPEKSIAIRD